MSNRQLLLKSVKEIKGGRFLMGAHHPHCPAYDNHLLWVAGHPLCLGCTCMYTGIGFGMLLITIISWSSVTFWDWVFLNIIFTFPTAIQPKLQNKFFKIISRFLLGLSISFYLISALLIVESPINDWLFRVVAISLFFLLYKGLQLLRSRYTKSPCDDCLLGYFPTCDWNLPNLLAHSDDDLVKYLRESDLEIDVTNVV